MTDSAPLRRLARRVQFRAQVTAGARRASQSLPAALQIVIAAVASYSIAHFLLGHATPLIAVTVTITSLGIARDARPRKVLETAIGVTVGIALSEVIVLVIGKGGWQLAIVLFATLVITRAVSANPAFAVAAAVQSTLVVLLPDPAGGPFTRSLDALVAGAVALAVTALIPRDPARAAARDRRALFAVLQESVDSIVDCLNDADEGAGELALSRLRRTQPMIDAWTTTHDTALSVSRISPFLRSRLPTLERSTRVLAAADLASRHLRTLSRRVEFLVRDGVQRPALAGFVAQIATGLKLLGDELDDPQVAGAARSLLSDVARRLEPAPGSSVPDAAIVLLLRPLVIDLLVGTGMPIEEARGLLPKV